MNKQTFSIEFSFDIDAGTIELLDEQNQLPRILKSMFIQAFQKQNRI